MGVLWFLDSKKLQKFAIKTFKTEVEIIITLSFAQSIKAYNSHLYLLIAFYPQKSKSADILYFLTVNKSHEKTPTVNYYD